jgi:flavin reductase (DIM6/NTAB) family NADH-FMN oxidoreductase RutF
MTDAGRPFDELTAELPAPMTIVTTSANGQRAGCLVGFHTQSSIDPVRFLVCLSRRNHTYDVAMRARVLAVHLLRDAESDRRLARLFGEETGDAVDKFDSCAWSSGPAGVPVLDDCDWFAGTIIERIPYGDHTGFLLDVLDGGRATRTDEPHLTFERVKDLDPGHDA